MPVDCCVICGRDDNSCFVTEDGPACYSLTATIPRGWARLPVTPGSYGEYYVYHRPTPNEQPPDEQADTPYECVIVSMDEVAEEAVEWLWQGRIELGCLNILCGYPGVSKSLLALDISAHATTGAKWPDAITHDHAPGNCILLPAEDHIAKAVKPRGIAAGIDWARTKVIKAVRAGDRLEAVNLQRHLEAVRRAIASVGDVQLVVLDPLNSFLGDTDSNSNEQVRRVLEPLCAIAESMNFALVVIVHVNKMTSQLNPLDRVSGSRAIAALARTVAIIGEDPDDKTQFIYAMAKVNHARKPGPLVYTIENDDAGRPCMAWLAGEAATDAAGVLTGTTGRRKTAVDRAVEWVKDALEAGPMPSKDLEGMADAAGIPASTLRKAKERLGVVPEQIREDGKVVGWTVSLPEGGATL